MRTFRFLLAAAMALSLAPAAGGSAIVAVGDAAVTVGTAVVQVEAKAVGAAVDLLTPSAGKTKA